MAVGCLEEQVEPYATEYSIVFVLNENIKFMCLWLQTHP